MKTAQDEATALPTFLQPLLSSPSLGPEWSLSLPGGSVSFLFLRLQDVKMYKRVFHIEQGF